ncbi:DUF7683 domain-containing protein [Chromobacterium violaceum]|uniref:DUF7683 domain-containing protein n=1 Tax=Chromobacterium violaceum (strain ATCC 12472 / DSM 30191 / JCM 1249 / CCUG 213 / NBRC 12614 / NCIMB 9131 / NCTC 9757 / MK) TaxID=243365 RepID=Q7NU33_CHRVO|nr:hypothetical protein [Chromobacterium violaceum]AAQ60538.1 hypothetical protein CV_2870 [Chromobacterium violaceum ATCC 12472]
MIKRYVSVYNENTDELVGEFPVSSDQALTVLISLYGDQVNDPEFYAEYPIDGTVAAGLLRLENLAIEIAGKDCVYYLTCG